MEETFLRESLAVGLLARFRHRFPNGACVPVIEAILQGERNPVRLAGMVDRRVRSRQDKIAKALVGDYRAEHVFQLKTAFELWEF